MRGRIGSKSVLFIAALALVATSPAQPPAECRFTFRTHLPVNAGPRAYRIRFPRGAAPVGARRAVTLRGRRATPGGAATVALTLAAQPRESDPRTTVATGTLPLDGMQARVFGEVGDEAVVVVVEPGAALGAPLDVEWSIEVQSLRPEDKDAGWSNCPVVEVP